MSLGYLLNYSLASVQWFFSSFALSQVLQRPNPIRYATLPSLRHSLLTYKLKRFSVYPVMELFWSPYMSLQPVQPNHITVSKSRKKRERENVTTYFSCSETEPLKRRHYSHSFILSCLLFLSPYASFLTLLTLSIPVSFLNTRFPYFHLSTVTSLIAPPIW